MNLEAAILHLGKNTLFQKIIQSTTVLPFTPSGRVYFDLLESIVSQQLSVKAASTIFNRFLALFPENYPNPEALVSINPEQLRTAGLSVQKSAYLKNVARFSLENNLENYDWDLLPDQDVLRLLTQIKGVGRWTAEMVLMFTLGRPDIFPIDDLGIQQAMIKLFELTASGKDLKRLMLEHAEPWRPYRTVACRYLWRWKDGN